MLAQAWLESAPRRPPAARREEVRAFYAENPALFAERRIYRLRELIVSAPAEMAEALRAEAAKARDLDELAGWLRRAARYSVDSRRSPPSSCRLPFCRAWRA